MKLQQILSSLQKLHPKEIDLSLDRIQNLCNKLGNPQDKIKAISIVGTNGKYSTIQAMFSISKEANFKCNIYTSPHIKSINERFIFNNEELNDEPENVNSSPYDSGWMVKIELSTDSSTSSLLDSKSYVEMIG